MPEFTDVLAAAAATRAHPVGTPCTTCPTGTLADRPDATVVRHGRTVLKAHAPGTDRTRLGPRLTVAARTPGVLLPPLTPTPTDLHGRLVTCWPYGTPVDPGDPDAAPWEAAGTLLAALHRSHPVPGLPAMRGPAKAARAVARLTGRPGLGEAVREAWAALPAWARAEAPVPGPRAVCHGDFHLGQLVRHPGPNGPWRLIDVDDLGLGAPAWDLARPAAWFACGLLPPDEWSRFLAAYRRSGGPAVPPDGDPWPALDVPARALTVQSAAQSLLRADREGRAPDEVELALVDACSRMVSVPAPRPPASAS
ncbi:aminoglycoside phosphotransferase family protein [Streptomyces sp. XM83C]|uniref:phosphotransferase family protein n=1 Tax=unclassified Streptomyces TaxID=2593676 RepID=UPI001FFBB711|nr:aminoglycoside phosphotransferase family protein [Streptomyces sp. XM83C]MCK1822998.1 aminoglycoside phosphotransferase family protein [Streptomyces sp. XM83C]